MIRRKEIIKDSAAIHQVENRKPMEKINATKS